MMRALILTTLMSLAASDAALCERLDKRFGAERERGYRAEREFEGRDSGFHNRDRANFLGAKQPEQPNPEWPRQDLQAPAAIGLQR
ncbi:hypothetical protein E0H22_12655 [Rhodopseudomonas boonkerdii]|uniref:hypothetical protein n=1 Tax=Rhodopseudomonas boonkerdii TaxID=475937 RepID=UPI001E418612|nr:hypothetical protein [Rhodopseudomonas boonkerdii]UGV26468.1 hypothetical protein E0H22_12655 [Rhodopseudomonas boonkerdii]